MPVITDASAGAVAGDGDITRRYRTESPASLSKEGVNPECPRNCQMIRPQAIHQDQNEVMRTFWASYFEAVQEPILQPNGTRRALS